MIATYRAAMDKGQHTNKTILSNYKPPFTVDWSPYKDRHWTDAGRHARADGAAEASSRIKATTVPADFKLHSRVEKVIADRRAMGEGKLPLDWGMGETLAYATLLDEGLRRAHFRRGRRPRHVLAPPRGAARPEPREVGFGHVDAAAAHQGRPAAISRSSIRC